MVLIRLALASKCIQEIGTEPFFDVFSKTTHSTPHFQILDVIKLTFFYKKEEYFLLLQKDV